MHTFFICLVSAIGGVVTYLFIDAAIHWYNSFEYNIRCRCGWSYSWKILPEWFVDRIAHAHLKKCPKQKESE